MSPLHTALSVEVAVPAVALEYSHLVLREPLAVADGRVALDVTHGAHAGDDARHGGMAQDIAERYLGYVVLARPELGDDGLHALVDFLFAVAAEVVVAEIAFFEGDIGRDPARQGTLIERHPDYDADVVLQAGGKELVLRALVEDVVDHLHCVYRASLDEPHRVRRLVVVYGDAESADLTFPFQVLDRLEPVPLADPVILPDVELLHVDGVQPQVGEALLRTLLYVISGERLLWGYAIGSGPHPVLRRDLGRDVDGLVPLLDYLPHEPLAVSLAVGQGRVYEIETEVHGPVQGLQRFLILRAEPGVAGDAPGPVAYLRYFQARPAERSVVHAASIYTACRMVSHCVTTTGVSRNRWPYLAPPRTTAWGIRCRLGRRKLSRRRRWRTAK